MSERKLDQIVLTPPSSKIRSILVFRAHGRYSAFRLCARHVSWSFRQAVVVLVCSSKEQPLVFCVQRCCVASVMGLAPG